jgi:hypothetical protein
MAAPWNPSACSPAVKTAALHLLPCLVKKGSDGGGDPLAGRPRCDGEEAHERIGRNAARVSSVGFPWPCLAGSDEDKASVVVAGKAARPCLTARPWT